MRITGFIREVLYFADVWGLPVIVASQGIQTALDDMGHEMACQSFRARGISSQMSAVLLRELSGLQAVMTLPAAGTTQNFSYSKGGKLGGVETPFEWNAMIDHSLEPVIVSWELRGFGFKLGTESSSKTISHAVWADNIFIFASSVEMFRTMVADLTEQLMRQASNGSLLR